MELQGYCKSCSEDLMVVARDAPDGNGAEEGSLDCGVEEGRLLHGTL